MQRFLRRTYRFALRVQGFYGLFLTALVAIAFGAEYVEGQTLNHLLITFGLGLTVSMVLAMPQMTPSWLVNPMTGRSGFSIFVLSGLLIILYIVVAITGVIGLQIEEPASRSLAMLACGPSLVIGNLIGWGALILGIWVKGGGMTPPKPKKVQIPERGRMETADLRQLRHSRMHV